MTSGVALSLSGGLDSAVLCAALLRESGRGPVLPVFFRYGSRHNLREEAAARHIADHYGLELLCLDLSPAFRHVSSALLAHDPGKIPKVGYDGDSMAATVVPGRNLVFASVLASVAESRALSCVALATHAGDHHLYPDCRPAFNRALDAVVRESSGGRLAVLTPFSSLTKADIVARGAALDVPFVLTRSCYEADETACGLCGTCRERLDAFAANRLTDPVAYAVQG